MIKKAEPPYVPMGKQAFDKFMQVLPMELMEQATGGKLPALAYPEWQQIAAELDAKIERMTAELLKPDHDAETVVRATMLQEGYFKLREALTQGKTIAQVEELSTQLTREFTQKYPDYAPKDSEGAASASTPPADWRAHHLQLAKWSLASCKERRQYMLEHGETDTTLDDKLIELAEAAIQRIQGDGSYEEVSGLVKEMQRVMDAPSVDAARRVKLRMVEGQLSKLEQTINDPAVSPRRVEVATALRETMLKMRELLLSELPTEEVTALSFGLTESLLKRYPDVLDRPNEDLLQATWNDAVAKEFGDEGPAYVGPERAFYLKRAQEGLQVCQDLLAKRQAAGEDLHDAQILLDFHQELLQGIEEDWPMSRLSAVFERLAKQNPILPDELMP